MHLWYTVLAGLSVLEHTLWRAGAWWYSELFLTSLLLLITINDTYQPSKVLTGQIRNEWGKQEAWKNVVLWNAIPFRKILLPNKFLKNGVWKRSQRSSGPTSPLISRSQEILAMCPVKYKKSVLGKVWKDFGKANILSNKQGTSQQNLQVEL